MTDTDIITCAVPAYTAWALIEVIDNRLNAIDRKLDRLGENQHTRRSNYRSEAADLMRAKVALQEGQSEFIDAIKAKVNSTRLTSAS